MKKLILIGLLFISFNSNSQSLKDSLYMFQGDLWAFEFPSLKAYEARDSIVKEEDLETFIYLVDTCYMYNDFKRMEKVYGCLIKLLYPSYANYVDSLFVYSEDVYYFRGRKVSSVKSEKDYYDKRKDRNKQD